jgi:putative nucleotidyltransferase with HDIG domain
MAETKNIYIPRTIAASSDDAKVKTGKASVELRNGDIVEVGAKVDGVYTLAVVTSATSATARYGIVYNADVATEGKYRGLSDDPRDVVFAAGTIVNVLLKRLLTEAPGTYHHSIIVGNLAEAAADAVGGDSLLVRVGAYYHDIGKIKRPYFFIENQMTCDNPHDKIAPSLSTLILTSHVKDGVEMARELKLPQGIIDIIEQHHGSGLVSFFYHKALESDRPETVTEEEYRYEGPKPQTREAAIVMLADTVEAAVRSLNNRTPGRVEGLVRKIIKDKLNDGQLDESDLTFKDLNIIANSFVRILSGIFHSRVEYPDMSQEIERRKKNGSTRKQLAGKVNGG